MRAAIAALLVCVSVSQASATVLTAAAEYDPLTGNISLSLGPRIDYWYISSASNAFNGTTPNWLPGLPENNDIDSHHVGQYNPDGFGYVNKWNLGSIAALGLPVSNGKIPDLTLNVMSLAEEESSFNIRVGLYTQPPPPPPLPTAPISSDLTTNAHTSIDQGSYHTQIDTQQQLASLNALNSVSYITYADKGAQATATCDVSASWSNVLSGRVDWHFISIVQAGDYNPNTTMGFQADAGNDYRWNYAFSLDRSETLTFEASAIVVSDSNVQSSDGIQYFIDGSPMYEAKGRVTIPLSAGTHTIGFGGGLGVGIGAPPGTPPVAYEMTGSVVWSVPEPATLSLLALGGLAILRRRK